MDPIQKSVPRITKHRCEKGGGLKIKRMKGEQAAGTLPVRLLDGRGLALQPLKVYAQFESSSVGSAVAEGAKVIAVERRVDLGRDAVLPVVPVLDDVLDDVLPGEVQVQDGDVESTH